MSTKPITFRIDLESAPGQIFTKWEAMGYKPRQIIEMALQFLDGVDPSPQHEMNDATLVYLQGVVERLETVADTLQKGGALSTNQQTAIDEALGSQFVQGMKRLVKPGFTSRPESE